jgi:hypothetical protein
MTTNDVNRSSRITWNHPVVQMGVVPGYLVQELFGYTDSTWKKKHRELAAFCCKTMNGEPWFCLQSLCAYLGSSQQPEDEE